MCTQYTCMYIHITHRHAHTYTCTTVHMHTHRHHTHKHPFKCAYMIDYICTLVSAHSHTCTQACTHTLSQARKYLSLECEQASLEPGNPVASECVGWVLRGVGPHHPEHLTSAHKPTNAHTQGRSSGHGHKSCISVFTQLWFHPWGCASASHVASLSPRGSSPCPQGYSFL